MATAAAVIVARERRIVDAFVRAGATSPDRARTPDDLGIDHLGLAWRRLRDHAVARESEPGSGRYYVDVEVWQSLRRIRHKVLVVMIVIVIAIGALVTVATRAH